MSFWGPALLVVCLGSMVACVVKYPPPTTEERHAAEDERVSSRLPDGCEIRDVGQYRDIDHVVVVYCDGRPTVTTTSERTWTTTGAKGIITTHSENSASVVFGEEQ